MKSKWTLEGVFVAMALLIPVVALGGMGFAVVHFIVKFW